MLTINLKNEFKSIKKHKEQNLANNYQNNESNYLNENPTTNNNFNYLTSSNIYTNRTFKNSNQTSYNNTYSNFHSNLSSHFPDLDYINDIQLNDNSSLIQNELHSLKLDYTTLNNDNIILREDINQLYEINKHLERSLDEERSHNYELAKQNDILNNERRNLYLKIDEANKKTAQIKSLSKKEAELMNRQIFYEDVLNKKEYKYNLLLDKNNKLNEEYNLLNDKYIKLQEKNEEDENELNEIKLEQEEKINKIEKQMNILFDEINNLKKENKELKNENDIYKNKIMNKEKEKEEYYNKYKEQKIINEMLTKENNEIKQNLLEHKKFLNKMENQEIIKEKIKRNNSENKIRIIQDLQNKIQRYKIKRGINNYNGENE